MRQFKITNNITTRDSQSIEKYFNEVSAIKMISPDEEAALAERIRTGDMEALERLVTANLRFVISVAKQYQHRNLPLIDLISEGNIGLIKAARRFDATKGFRFISYAVWWIRQCIIEAVLDNAALVRLPQNKWNEVSKINSLIGELEQQLQREPTTIEIATALEARLYEVDEVLLLAQGHVSFDSPVHEESEEIISQTLADSMLESPDAMVAHKESLAHEVQRMLALLNKQEAHVVRMFFGIGYERPMITEEIAEIYGVSVQRVRQIKLKALRLLRNRHKTSRLKVYLS